MEAARAASGVSRLPRRRLALGEPSPAGGHRHPLEPRPPEPGQPASIDTARVEALAQRAIHLPALGPVAEDHGLRPPPGFEPRPAVHHPDLGELLPRALLRALAGCDAGV